MSRVTLRVVDGADRGEYHENVETPVTIGREEGNDIQLNDERVSRFHVKVQSDGERLVLTDLESTNGTRVNGEDVRLRVLQAGDVIQVGRSVILLGTREEIAERMAHFPPQHQSKGWFKIGRGSSSGDDSPSPSGSDSSIPWKDVENLQDFMFNHEPPELPSDLTATQAAQFSLLIDFLRIRIRSLIGSVSEEKSGRITLDALQWQKLLDLQARLAEMAAVIGEPESSDE